MIYKQMGAAMEMGMIMLMLEKEMYDDDTK